MLERILGAVEEFAGERTGEDDITLVVARAS
jgi:hypothetical protein